MVIASEDKRRLSSLLKIVSIFSLCLLSVQPALTQQFSREAWVGTWKLDRSASRFVGFVVSIHHVAHRYRFEIEGTTIDIGDDGKDYTTVPTRTTSFRQLSATQWLRVHKIMGREVDRSVFTLSPEGKSFVIHTQATDNAGKQHVSDETFKREGAGTGIDGTWRSTSAGINVVDTLDITLAAGSALRFTYPTEGLSFVTFVDGATAPYSGPKAVPSVRVAVSAMSARQLRLVDFLQGKPYQEEMDVLSPDGRRLTITSWHVSNPADKDIAVYIRH